MLIYKSVIMAALLYCQQAENIGYSWKVIKNVYIGERVSFYCDHSSTKKIKGGKVSKVEISIGSQKVFETGVTYARKFYGTVEHPPTYYTTEGFSAANNFKQFKVTVTIPSVQEGHTGPWTCIVHSGRTTDKQIMVALFVSYHSGPLACYDGWARFPYSDICVQLFVLEDTWAEARSFCVDRHNADLPMIVDEDFDKFISAMIDLRTHRRIWLGLSDLQYEGEFRWLDAETNASFYRWAKNEPKMSDSYNCVEKGNDTVDGKWEVISCEDRRMILCERDLWSSSQMFRPKFWSDGPWMFVMRIVVTVGGILLVFGTSCFAGCYLGIKMKVVPRAFLPVAATFLGNEFVKANRRSIKRPFIPRGGLAVVYSSSLENNYKLGRDKEAPVSETHDGKESSIS